MDVEGEQPIGWCGLWDGPDPGWRRSCRGPPSPWIRRHLTPRVEYGLRRVTVPVQSDPDPGVAGEFRPTPAASAARAATRASITTCSTRRTWPGPLVGSGDPTEISGYPTS